MKPIIFNSEMVRAILDGRKTTTRRVVKTEPSKEFRYLEMNSEFVVAYFSDSLEDAVKCPFGILGDQLWVLETWRAVEQYPPPGNYAEKVRVEYRAGGEQWIKPTKECRLDHEDIWRPSIHMPKWASRITLEVTGVRVERLQDITEEDAKAEGCKASESVEMKDGSPCYTEEFKNLWYRAYGSDSPKAWESNPWIFVIEFSRITAP